MSIKKSVFKLSLILGIPFTYLSSLWLKFVLKSNAWGKVEENISNSLGVLPILDHYYQPLINPKKHLKKSLRDDRSLPGIDFNVQEQLDILSKFNFNDELLSFPINNESKPGEKSFFYNNGSYGSGDAEYLYNITRHFKPRKIIEIGSGNSTLMVLNALDKNGAEDENYQCEHICVEPYEMPWLGSKNIKLRRDKVEDIEPAFFEQLNENDILFIDSSHIIRPQGDVIFEYFEILPVLKKGVIIHIHDIFTPKDYLDEWVYKKHLLWNEQYLLEAFLTFNNRFKIIGATNYLSHNHVEAFSARCPVFAKQSGREPGAFWIQKI
jgi:Methyltransferase domain